MRTWEQQLQLFAEWSFSRDRTSSRHLVGAALCGGLFTPSFWHLLFSARGAPESPLKRGCACGLEAQQLRYRHLEDVFEAWLALRRSTSYRLGGAALTLAKTREVRRSLARYRRVEAPAAGCLTRSPERAPLVGATEPPALTVLAPTWMQPLLSLEPGLALEPREDTPTVVCLGAGPVPPPNGEAVAWLVGDQRTPLDEAWLARCSRVEELGPAVQPRLHNPVRWWNCRCSNRPRSGAPRAWTELFDRARTLISRDPGESQLAYDLRRYLVSRVTASEASLARRLAHLKQVFGLPAEPAQEPLVSAVLCTRRPDFLAHAVDSFARQDHPRKELVLVLHGEGFEEVQVQALTAGLAAPVQVLRAPDRWNLGEALQFGTEATSGDYIWKLDDDDHYARGFLGDALFSLSVSGAGLVGKRVRLVEFFPEGEFYAVGLERDLEFNWWPLSFPGGTMVLRRDTAERVPWRPVPRSEDSYLCEDCLSKGIPVLHGSRFHFRTRRMADGAFHTNPRSKAQYLGTKARRLAESEALRWFLNETSSA